MSNLIRFCAISIQPNETSGDFDRLIVFYRLVPPSWEYLVPLITYFSNYTYCHYGTKHKK